MSKLKLHNAMWPGLVGKGDGKGQEPAISLDRMLELTAAAEVDGERFDGVDWFLFHPHFDPKSTRDDIIRLADKVAGYGLSVGTLVAPVWPGTVGDSAMGDDAQQARYLEAVRMSCQVARTLNEHGVRKYGSIRVDSASSFAAWMQDPERNTARIIETFKLAADIAEGEGEQLVAEMEICWGGMYSIDSMLHVLEGVGKPESFGLQVDLAHVHTAMLGFNAPHEAVLMAGYTDEEFTAAYRQMTDKLRPWMLDFHVAQNDGTVYGAGDHDKTGKHCLPFDPDGQLFMELCATYWFEGIEDRLKHICWDGCMFPNTALEDPRTWNDVLLAMTDVREAVAVEQMVG